MSSIQQIGNLKQNGVGKGYFDMENLLTRSLYRVMNNTDKVPSKFRNSGHNVDKNVHFDRFSTIEIARPNNHKIGDSEGIDMELQLKLLAQEVCSRVERRYEKKLEEIRDRERRETERRLTSIRSEFEAKYKMQIGKFEKEKHRLMDQMAERERTIENRMELRLEEREDDLESRRRMLDNRMSELLMNKEAFEKMKEEWNRKMEDEMEQMRIEREKLAISAVQTSARQKTEGVIEHELRIWKKRAHDLEKDANETRQKIAELMTQNFRLSDRAGNADQLKQELNVTLSALNETREELTTTKVENRRMGDFDRIKEENEQLRIEIERLKIQSSTRIQSAVDEAREEFLAKEEKMKRLLGAARASVVSLTEKCRELEMERNVLRQELKSMQKMVGRETFSQVRRRQTERRRSRSPESESLSEGELEILNIRQRIQNLNEIAKDLDASVEHFSMINNDNTSGRMFNDSKIEQYDDFCRALHTPNNTVDQKTSSPQKKEKKVEKNEEDWMKRSRRVISPPPVRKEEEEKRNDTPKKVDRRAEMLKLAEKEETSADNPMFQNVDPVMAEYMKKIMGNRETVEKKEEKEQRKEVEVTLAEELELEKEEEEKKDDEWW